MTRSDMPEFYDQVIVQADLSLQLPVGIRGETSGLDLKHLSALFPKFQTREQPTPIIE